MTFLSMLGNLSRDAIKALARNLFPGFYERDISANKALDELRELGLGYRRQDFLSDYREGRESYNDRIRVRYVNIEKTPSEGILKEMYHGVPDRYSFVFRAQGTNTLTGEDEERYFFYHRNSILTRGQMEEEALGWYTGEYEKYQFAGVSVQLVEGYINPIWR